MPIWTLPGFSGSVGQGTPTQQQINGYRFTVEESTPVDLVGFYRRQTVGQAKPTNLMLWQMSSASAGTVLRTVSAPIDDGTVGWQDSSFSSAITLEPGITYQVTGCHDAGVYGILSNGQRNPPNYPFVFTDTTGRYRLNSCASPPDTAGTDTFVTVRLGYSGESPPDPGEAPTNLSIENALARWFSSDVDNTRQEHLPWQTLLRADNINEKMDIIDPIIDDIIATVDTALGPGGSLVTGALRVALDAFSDLIRTDVNAAPGTIMGPGNPTIADVMNAIDGIPTDTGRPGVDTTIVSDPTFTETDELLGSGSFSWTIPADKYVLEITNPNDLREGLTIDGIPFLKHRGKWSPLEGDIVGDARSIVGVRNLLHTPGARLHGVICYLEPHIEWSIKAFDYLGA